MTKEVYFVIDGEAVGKGRPRFSRRGNYVKAYTPPKTANYEEKVKDAYFTEYGNIKPLWGENEPLEMVINVYFEIPKSASKKKRFKLLTEERPTKKPDVDNIAKAIMDALSKDFLYHDDSQIVSATINKYWSETPKAEVIIRGIQNEESICQQRQETDSWRHRRN